MTGFAVRYTRTTTETRNTCLQESRDGVVENKPTDSFSQDRARIVTLRHNKLTVAVT